MTEWKAAELGKILSGWEVGTLDYISLLLIDGESSSPKPVKSEIYMVSVKDLRYNDLALGT
jgi:hypothetical protein